MKAVSYYRMSSDDQSDSLDQQRTEVRAYALANGFELVAEYNEPGKSGSLRQKARTEWARLLADAEAGGFLAVLAWDLSRLSRADPLKAAADKDRLRTAGVYVQTVREGRIDWDTFSGRLFDYVSQEKNHAYSKELSKNSIRGREALLAKGESPHGQVPYGYRRRYTGPSGEYVARRDEKFRKPKGWARVIEIDPEESEIVREIFRQYLDEDRSIRAIAEALTLRGTPAPRGPAWRHLSVGGILANPTYCGRLETASRPHCKPGREVHNKMSPAISVGIFPRIVSDADFEAARKKRASSPGPRSGQRSGGLFSGFLRCGNCGGPMTRHKAQSRSGPFYTCGNRHTNPGATPCGSWRAFENQIIYPLIATFVKAVDRSLVESVRARPSRRSPAGAESLRKRLAAAEAKVTKARARYLECSDELLPDIEAGLKLLVAERDSLSAQVQTAEASANDPGQEAAWWNERRGKLVELRPAHPRYALTEDWPLAEIDAVRGLFRRTGFRASLWFKSEPYGKYQRHTLDWARVEITVMDRVTTTTIRKSTLDPLP